MNELMKKARKDDRETTFIEIAEVHPENVFVSIQFDKLIAKLFLGTQLNLINGK